MNQEFKTNPEWTENEIEAKKLDGFSICPFLQEKQDYKIKSHP